MSLIENLKKSKYWIIIGCTYLIIKSIYAIYQDNTQYLHQTAISSFEEILQQEIQRFDTTSLAYSKSLIDGRERHSHYSPILMNMSLDADSLNLVWREILHDKNISAKTYLRISNIKGLNNGNQFYSDSSINTLSNDSLFSFYLGPHNEIEIAGFISYHWWNLFDGRLPVMIILLLAGYFIPGFLFVKLLQMSKYVNVKRNMEKLKSEQVSHILKDECTIYNLEDDVFYDSCQRIIKRNDIVEKLTPQQAVLLETLLKAEQNKLTQKEIDILLWPDGSGTPERLYTAICRLRKSLEKVTSYRLDCQIDIYQLRKSNSIEND